MIGGRKIRLSGITVRILKNPPVFFAKIRQSEMGRDLTWAQENCKVESTLSGNRKKNSHKEHEEHKEEKPEKTALFFVLFVFFVVHLPPGRAFFFRYLPLFYSLHALIPALLWEVLTHLIGGVCL
jgi:hypothetical protein